VFTGTDDCSATVACFSEGRTDFRVRAGSTCGTRERKVETETQFRGRKEVRDDTFIRANVIRTRS